MSVRLERLGKRYLMEEMGFGLKAVAHAWSARSEGVVWGCTVVCVGAPAVRVGVRRKKRSPYSNKVK